MFHPGCKLWSSVCRKGLFEMNITINFHQLENLLLDIKLLISVIDKSQESGEHIGACMTKLLDLFQVVLAILTLGGQANDVFV
jgi:hypothetical protein